MLKYAAVFTVLLVSTASAQNTVQHPMPFGTCIQQLSVPVSGAIQPAVVTIDNEMMKQVQYVVTDGIVTITCNQSDQTVTITHQ